MTSLLVWQLVDSAFPTGGFAHSYGLEAAWQHGEVSDADALAGFVRASVWQSGWATLPLLNEVHRAPERLAELDDYCDAFLTNAVANRASRIHGRAFASTCARVWPTDGLRALDAQRASCSHMAPTSGAVFASLAVPLATAQRITLFITARGVLSAAVRLGIVGGYQAQRMQFDASPDIDAVLECCGALGADDLTQTAPMIDVLQSTHDRLYSRLFQS